MTHFPHFRKILSFLVVLVLVVLAGRSEVYAQATIRTDAEVTCAASGSSTQLLATRSSRQSFTIWNTSATDVRWGAVTSGTPNLTTSNSVLLKAGVAYADSMPGVFHGRMVCMSTTGSTVSIGVTETYR